MATTDPTHESDFMLEPLENSNERLPLPHSAADLHLEKNESAWNKVLAFMGLTVTTAASFSLLYATRVHWVLPENLHKKIIVNRAGTQLVIQILATILGLLQITAVCQLIHFAARLHMRKNKVSLQWTQLYHALSTTSVDWSIGFRRCLLLLIFLGSTAVPAALWAGSLTPIATSVTRHGTLEVPQYNDMSYIHYYPSDAAAVVPVVRTWQGVFTYAVAMQYLGQLISSAAKATTRNGSRRRHTKYDTAEFTFVGRSYGVGSSVGLMDHSLLNHTLVQSYSFVETGYHAVVHCSYNRSSNFRLVSKNSSMLYSAKGLLPNSPPKSPEGSTYFGQNMTAIVAIGVAREPVDESRWLAIAAGDSYTTLNSTQCLIDFIPSQFLIKADLLGRNITVTRTGNATDIDSSRSLTQFVTYSLQQVSTDSTNLYSSSIGNAFNASITDYMSAAVHLNKSSSTEKAVLAGITNSVEAMIDDVLISSASAQLMVAKDKRKETIAVRWAAFRLGQNIYIYLICAFNMIVVLAVLVEAIRTRSWRYLSRFSFQTPSHLILATAAQYGASPSAPRYMETEQENSAMITAVPKTKRVLAALTVNLFSSNKGYVKLSLGDAGKA